MAHPVVLLLALVAIAAAQIPPRPNIPFNFESRVAVEQHTATEHLLGEGIWAVDYTNSKSVENYKLHGTRHVVIPLFLYDLQRFDLGQEFTINSEDFNECRERQLPGKMYPPFGWLANASYLGKDIIKSRHIEVDLWGLRYDGGSLEVGVMEPHWNTPFFYRRFDQGGEFYIEFHQFQANATINPKTFDIPQPCQGFAAAAAAARPLAVAAPTRPVIPNTFDAELAAEIFHNGRRLDGNVHWSSDHSGSGKDVEIQILHDDQRHEDIRTFTLNRYDLKTEFEVDSWNRTTCRKTTLNGTQPGLWDWVGQASYVGQRQERDGTVDLWQFLPGGGLNLTLGVLDRNPNSPYYLHRETPETQARFFFQNFTPRSPDPNLFTIPRECS